MQVSSTLSHLPPLPPLSPTPTGNSSSFPNRPNVPSSNRLHSPHLTHLSSFANLASSSPRPSISTQSSSSGLVVLPNGTALPTSREHDRGGSEPAGVGRSVHETLVHSSASSPWSLLTVHVLPLFAGEPLKTPIEDLKQVISLRICFAANVSSVSSATPISLQLPNERRRLAS